MKKILYLILMTVCLVACTATDDNYKDYLKDIPTYSPRIENLILDVPQNGTVVLSWDNPNSELVQKIRIVCVDAGVDDTSETMISTYTINDLQLRGYHFSVYTIDVNGNLSIPISGDITPALIE